MKSFRQGEGMNRRIAVVTASLVLGVITGCTSMPATSSSTPSSASTSKAAAAHPVAIVDSNVTHRCASRLQMGLAMTDLRHAAAAQQREFAHAVGRTQPETRLFGQVLASFTAAVTAHGRTAAAGSAAFKVRALSRLCAAAHG
jgi:hypothetical protein